MDGRLRRVPAAHRACDPAGGPGPASGWRVHNRYPALGQSVQQQFWEGAGDGIFFVRSAGIDSVQRVPAMWGGDNDTDWDGGDGLPAVAPQALSAGLLGFGMWGTDIAGYMTLGRTRPVGKELFLRWLQCGALFPLMRTHHGTARPRNWHLARDRQTLAIYTRYARLHMLLFPYWASLREEYRRAGVPPLRPLCWLDNRPQVWPRGDQFLIGDRLLAAPVLRPRARKRRLYLPAAAAAGVDWWSGRSYPAGSTATVTAPLSRLPLFVRAGTVLPLAEGARGNGGRPLGFVDTP